MGARHLICIVYRKQFILAQYCEWNGSPYGNGAAVWKFLRDPINIERLITGLEYLYQPDEAELKAIKEEIAKFDKELLAHSEYTFRNSGVNVLYPSLSRDSSAKLLSIIAAAGAAETPVEDKKKIPIQNRLDSVCEWFYVIDLDTKVLEILEGDQWDSDMGSRGEWLEEPARNRMTDVRPLGPLEPIFIQSFELGALPKNRKDFLRMVKEGRKREGTLLTEELKKQFEAGYETYEGSEEEGEAKEQEDEENHCTLGRYIEVRGYSHMGCKCGKRFQAHLKGLRGSDLLNGQQRC